MACHGPGVPVFQLPPGHEDKGILVIGQFRRLDIFSRYKTSLAVIRRENAVPEYDRFTRVIFPGQRVSQ